MSIDWTGPDIELLLTFTVFAADGEFARTAMALGMNMSVVSRRLLELANASQAHTQAYNLEVRLATMKLSPTCVEDIKPTTRPETDLTTRRHLRWRVPQSDRQNPNSSILGNKSLRAVIRIAFSSDGKWVVSNGRDGKVIVRATLGGAVFAEARVETDIATVAEPEAIPWLLAANWCDRSAVIRSTQSEQWVVWMPEGVRNLRVHPCERVVAGVEGEACCLFSLKDDGPGEDMGNPRG